MPALSRGTAGRARVMRRHRPQRRHGKQGASVPAEQMDRPEVVSFPNGKDATCGYKHDASARAAQIKPAEREVTRGGSTYAVVRPASETRPLSAPAPGRFFVIDHG